MSDNIVALIRQLREDNKKLANQKIDHDILKAAVKLYIATGDDTILRKVINA